MAGQELIKKRFDAAVWPHAGMLLRTAQILTHNTAEAEDLAQETLVKAFRSLDSFTDGTDARAWLLTILRRTRSDRLRLRATRQDHVSLEQLEVEPAADESPAGQHDSQWTNPEQILQQFSDQQVIDGLKQLPEDIRWTLLLVDVEGLDYAEAAGIMEVPVGTVKSRVFRGRGMLREALLPVAKQMRLVKDKDEEKGAL